jgi:hypothetical protein
LVDRAATTPFFFAIDDFVAKCYTVTTTDGDGKRFSLDVKAESRYDAARLYRCLVKNMPGCGFPVPTTSTTFEVVIAGRILAVSGVRLKKWIEKRRDEWKGPRGLLFKQRADDSGTNLQPDFPA